MTRYCIVSLSKGYSASFELNGLHYELFREQVEELTDTGVLHAMNMYTPFGCHRCHRPLGSHKKPRACPYCGTDQWGDFTLLYCRFCSALFELDWELRDSMRPWEVIPNCPACHHEQWCRAEEHYQDHLATQARKEVKSPLEQEEEAKTRRQEEEQAFLGLMEMRKNPQSQKSGGGGIVGEAYSLYNSTSSPWLKKKDVDYQTQPQRSSFTQSSAQKSPVFSIQPRTAEGWEGVGMVHFNATRYTEALEAFEQAIRLDPERSFGYLNKSNTLRALERYEEALTAYEQYEQLVPFALGSFAYSNKGDLLCVLKRYEEALLAYEQAIRLDPTSAFAYSHKGDALYALKRYEEALLAYEQVLRLDPGNTNAASSKEAVVQQLNSSRGQPQIAVCSQKESVTDQEGGKTEEMSQRISEQIERSPVHLAAQEPDTFHTMPTLPATEPESVVTSSSATGSVLPTQPQTTQTFARPPLVQKHSGSPSVTLVITVLAFLFLAVVGLMYLPSYPFFGIFLMFPALILFLGRFKPIRK